MKINLQFGTYTQIYTELQLETTNHHTRLIWDKLFVTKCWQGIGKYILILKGDCTFSMQISFETCLKDRISTQVMHMHVHAHACACTCMCMHAHAHNKNFTHSLENGRLNNIAHKPCAKFQVKI